MHYHIITYGCQMNVHESEKIAGLLQKQGYSYTNDLSNTDIIVFNTCCIRDNAEKRALGNIGALKKVKIKNPNLIIAVVGCMTQQKGVAEKLKQTFPFIDIILGTNNLHLLPYLITLNDKNNKEKIENDNTYRTDLEIDTFRTSFPNAWVNIIYGCNNYCTYCIVPYVRGREISRKPQDIINEVNFLLDQGYKEITLLGQNVDSYKYENYDFCYLLTQLSKIDRKFRLRFMTSHPKDFNKEVIEIINLYPNICKHIHLPVQSGSDKILKLMNRRYTVYKYKDIIETIYSKIKDVHVSTDIMVGFPNETEEDFLDTLKLVEFCNFSQAFTFVYSPRSGTPASKMKDIEESIKKDRITRLIKVQNAITKKNSDLYKNKIIEILIEDEKDNKFYGRSDNGKLVTIEKNADCRIGDFVNIKILSSNSSKLTGEFLK